MVESPSTDTSAAPRERIALPFCSLTCRLVDLGVWLDEGYRVGADERGDVP